MKNTCIMLLALAVIFVSGCATGGGNPLVEDLVKRHINEGCPLAQECRRQLELVCKTEIAIFTGVAFPIILALISYVWLNFKKARKNGKEDREEK